MINFYKFYSLPINDSVVMLKILFELNYLIYLITLALFPNLVKFIGSGSPRIKMNNYFQFHYI